MLRSQTGDRLPVIDCPLSIRSGKTWSREERRQMKGIELTERQSQMLDIIRRHLKRRGVPPSRTEMAREMGLASVTGVDGHLNALARKGWVELIPSVERGIRLLREGAPLLDPDELPTVAAGRPILAEETTEPMRLNDFESFAGQFEARPDWFVRVKGNSMDKVGFRTGDIVAVRRQPEARNGDIVVARIGSDITVKRYQRTRANRVELQPVSSDAENETIRIGPDTEDVEIIGIVVGAIIGTSSAMVRGIEHRLSSADTVHTSGSELGAEWPHHDAQPE